MLWFHVLAFRTWDEANEGGEGENEDMLVGAMFQSIQWNIMTNFA